MEQALIRITGRVQGVFYRAHAQDKANELMLNGYAKNLPDGRVEALVQGEKENIEKFIEWCKEGPPSAEVGNIQIKWQKYGSIIKGFSTY